MNTVKLNRKSVTGAALVIAAAGVAILLGTGTAFADDRPWSQWYSFDEAPGLQVRFYIDDTTTNGKTWVHVNFRNNYDRTIDFSYTIGDKRCSSRLRPGEQSHPYYAVTELSIVLTRAEFV